MKFLYLHIGLSKCGSSALQSWFSKNHGLLGDQGIFYADLDPKAKEGEISSGNGCALIDACETRDSHKISDCLQSVYASQQNCSLISAEQLQKLSRDCLLSLKKSCDDLGIEVQVIAYVRSAYEKSYSAYLQGVKRRGATQAFSNRERDKFESDKKHLFNYAHVWRDNLQVLNYDKMGKDIFSSFAKVLGLEISGFQNDIGRVNRSLTYGESKFLVEMNKLHKGIFSKEISNYLISKSPEKITYTHYSDDLIRWVETEAKDAVEAINSHFFSSGGGIKIYQEKKAQTNLVNEESFDHSVIVNWCLERTIEKGPPGQKFINFLRDFAIFMEHRDLISSRDVMQRARELRPSGVVIQEKLAFYNTKLRTEIHAQPKKEG